MHGMRRGLVLVGCAGGLLAPATALGVVIVPPGKSGASQYVEVVPTSKGNTPAPGAPGAGGSSGTSSSLPSLGRGRAGAAKLARLGSQGQAAAGLARATAPQPFRQAPAGGRVSALQLSRAHGGSAAGAIASALWGPDGLGVLLPGLLVVALLGAVMLLLVRLRRRGQSHLGA